MTAPPEDRPFPPGRSELESLGLPGPAAPPTSPLAFPDGGAWRLEIPSVEGPEALAEVIRTAGRLEVPVHRVSQGSGVGMLRDVEIGDMVQAAEENGIDLCLFVRPGADWDTGASAGTTGSVSARSRGSAQLQAGIAQARRAAALGVRSLLVSDEGLLWSLHRLRERGDLPARTRFKVSVMAAPANPAAFRVQGLLGADTVNVPSDLTIHQLAELRAAGPAAIDFYVESPDNVGGFVRHHEIAEVVRVSAPVYVKFGLRNARGVYPAGEHLAAEVLAATRERVRRARLGLDELERHSAVRAASPVGSHSLAAAERFPGPPPAAP